MADPIWSDAGVGFPPANPPTSASVLGRFLAEVPDPNMDFQPEATLKQWIAEGVQQFHQRVIEIGLQGQGKKGIPRDRLIFRQYLTGTAKAALKMTADTPDVSLPTDCHLLLDALLFPGQADEVIATEIDPGWDFRVKTFPSVYGPTGERPLFTVLSTGGGRFYMTGKVLANTEYGFRYLRTPKGVWDDAGTLRVDIPETFVRGPLFFGVARWYASREVDPAPYLAEAERMAQLALMPQQAAA